MSGLCPRPGLWIALRGRTAPGGICLCPTNGSAENWKLEYKPLSRPWADPRFGARAMRDTLMMQLLILLGMMVPAAPERTEHRYDAKIEHVLSYINENLSRELSVDALAEQVFSQQISFYAPF